MKHVGPAARFNENHIEIDRMKDSLEELTNFLHDHQPNVTCN